MVRLYPNQAEITLLFCKGRQTTKRTTKMAAPVSTDQLLPCYDFLQFQEALKKMRLMDDRIIHGLNDSLPTQSFKHKVDMSNTCKRIYEEMSSSHDLRDKSIRHCLQVVGAEVRQLRAAKEKDPDDTTVLSKLKKNQTTLRLMQQELGIEEIITDRTKQVFYERCRDSFTPPDEGSNK